MDIELELKENQPDAPNKDSLVEEKTNMKMDKGKPHMSDDHVETHVGATP